MRKIVNFYRHKGHGILHRRVDVMSQVPKKLVFWLLTRSDTIQAVQPQKTARGLNVWIKAVERLYYL